MRVRFGRGSSVTLFVLTLGASAHARTTAYVAHLNAAQTTEPQPAEDAGPKSTSTATGEASMTYDDTTRLLHGTLTYEALSGPATAVHIHEGTCGVGGNVRHSLDEEGAIASPFTIDVTLDDQDEASLLADGGLYFNIHTDLWRAEEIRGQILPASAPYACPPGAEDAGTEAGADAGTAPPPASASTSPPPSAPDAGAPEAAAPSATGEGCASGAGPSGGAAGALLAAVVVGFARLRRAKRRKP